MHLTETISTFIVTAGHFSAQGIYTEEASPIQMIMKEVLGLLGLEIHDLVCRTILT